MRFQNVCSYSVLQFTATLPTDSISWFCQMLLSRARQLHLSFPFFLFFSQQRPLLFPVVLLSYAGTPAAFFMRFLCVDFHILFSFFFFFYRIPRSFRSITLAHRFPWMTRVKFFFLFLLPHQRTFAYILYARVFTFFSLTRVVQRCSEQTLQNTPCSTFC